MSLVVPSLLSFANRPSIRGCPKRGTRNDFDTNCDKGTPLVVTVDASPGRGAIGEGYEAEV